MTDLCKLDNGDIKQFDICIGYRSEILPNPVKYEYLGKGYIHSNNGIKSDDDHRYKFYRNRKLKEIK